MSTCSRYEIYSLVLDKHKNIFDSLIHFFLMQPNEALPYMSFDLLYNRYDGSASHTHVSNPHTFWEELTNIDVSLVKNGLIAITISHRGSGNQVSLNLSLKTGEVTSLKTVVDFETVPSYISAGKPHQIIFAGTELGIVLANGSILFMQGTPEYGYRPSFVIGWAGYHKYSDHHVQHLLGNFHENLLGVKPDKTHKVEMWKLLAHREYYYGVLSEGTEFNYAAGYVSFVGDPDAHVSRTRYLNTIVSAAIGKDELEAFNKRMYNHAGTVTKILDSALKRMENNS